MTSEVWQDIDGYEGLYQVSNLGNVRNRHGRVLSPSSWKGYKRVNLCRNGNVSTQPVHRLVLMAFTDRSEWNEEVNHLNYNPSDNRLENLEWLTHTDNIRYSIPNKPKTVVRTVFHPTRNYRKVIQLSKDGEILRVWDNLSTIYRETGFEQTPIKCCCENKKHHKSAYGYKWAYAE